MKYPIILFTTLVIFIAGLNQRKTDLPSIQRQPIDLRQIQHLQPKGRVQDKNYNQIEIIDRLVALQIQAIPVLIDKLDDETVIHHQVMDFWRKVTVGDVALIILTDFFLDSSWTKATIPGVSWDEMLNRKNKTDTAEELLRKYVGRHGRRKLKEKWAKIWKENRDRLYWDDKERCFKLK